MKTKPILILLIAVAFLGVCVGLWLFLSPSADSSPSGVRVSENPYGKRWAPDGKSLYFGEEVNGLVTYHRYDPQTGKVTAYARSSRQYADDLSPDGRRVVFHEGIGNWQEYALEIGDLDSGRVTEILRTPVRIDYAAWPAQNVLLYSVVRRGEDASVYVVRPDGSGAKEVMRKYARIERYASDGSAFLYWWNSHKADMGEYGYYDLVTGTDRALNLAEIEGGRGWCVQYVAFLSRSQVIYLSADRFSRYGTPPTRFRVMDLRTQQARTLTFPARLPYGSHASFSPDLRHYCLHVERGIGERRSVELWVADTPEVTLRELGVKTGVAGARKAEKRGNR